MLRLNPIQIALEAKKVGGGDKVQKGGGGKEKRGGVAALFDPDSLLHREQRKGRKKKKGKRGKEGRKKGERGTAISTLLLIIIGGQCESKKKNPRGKRTGGEKGEGGGELSL